MGSASVAGDEEDRGGPIDEASIEDRVDALLMPGLTGHAVEADRGGQMMRGVGEGDGRLRSAVAESVSACIGTIPIRNAVPGGFAVGCGRRVVGGVDRYAQAPVDDLLKRLVGHALPLAGGHLRNTVGLEDSNAVALPAAEQHLVETYQLADRPHAVATRPWTRGPIAVGHGRRLRLAGCGVGHGEDLSRLFIATVNVWWHAHPRIVHA